MTKHTDDFGRDPALVSDHAPLRGRGPTGFDPAYEAWRPALVAFYEKDEAPTKALRLRQGAEFDYLDRRTVKALQAAFIVAAVNA